MWSDYLKIDGFWISLHQYEYEWTFHGRHENLTITYLTRLGTAVDGFNATFHITIIHDQFQLNFGRKSTTYSAPRYSSVTFPDGQSLSLLIPSYH